MRKALVAVAIAVTATQAASLRAGFHGDDWEWLRITMPGFSGAEAGGIFGYAMPLPLLAWSTVSGFAPLSATMLHLCVATTWMVSGLLLAHALHAAGFDEDVAAVGGALAVCHPAAAPTYGWLACWAYAVCTVGIGLALHAVASLKMHPERWPRVWAGVGIALLSKEPGMAVGVVVPLALWSAAPRGSPGRGAALASLGLALVWPVLRQWWVPTAVRFDQIISPDPGLLSFSLGLLVLGPALPWIPASIAFGMGSGDPRGRRFALSGVAMTAAFLIPYFVHEPNPAGLFPFDPSWWDGDHSPPRLLSDNVPQGLRTHALAAYVLPWAWAPGLSVFCRAFPRVRSVALGAILLVASAHAGLLSANAWREANVQADAFLADLHTAAARAALTGPDERISDGTHTCLALTGGSALHHAETAAALATPPSGPRRIQARPASFLTEGHCRGPESVELWVVNPPHP